ncbi:glycosyltransferase family 2 protein [Alteromonas gracilis]|uniref:glycosyltransferase family 2 protein n=1 Tax=Alteromonas gracilis TaxID=1479524 RepID=UPI003734FF0D
MNTPLVSVVMPIFNMQKYVELALLSVKQQTYSNLEIICVNDGSTDNSVDIVEQFDDPRIKLVNQANQGLSAARNTGMSHASGKYIALLDPDDLWLPEKIAQHVAHLERSPEVGISYCPSLFITEEGKRNGLGQFPKLEDISLKTVMCRNPIGNGSAPVIRKAMLDELSIALPRHHSGRTCFFDEAMRQSEDIDFWIYCALNANYKIEGIAKPLTLYRINANGLSANLAKQFRAWEYCMQKHLASAPFKVAPLYKKARAYQYRYLARRAVQSRSTSDAICYLYKAFKSDASIVTEEPKKTFITVASALLSALPGRLYSACEGAVLHMLERRKQRLLKAVL